MKREIKFRAWDTKKNEWIWHSFDKYISDSHKDILPNKRIGTLWLTPYWTENKDDIIWLQFTGLHDKNGKEIYEGDVLKIHNKELGSPEDMIAVKYSGSGFVIYDPNCCKVCRVGSGCISNLDEWGSKSYEVIGNIFDNPELLKP